MKIFFRSFIITLIFIFSGSVMVSAGITDEAAYIPDNTDFAVYINYDELFSYMRSGGVNPEDYTLMFGDREAQQFDEVLKRFNLKLSDVKEVFATICLSEIANQKFNFIIMINTGGKGDIPEEFRTGALDTGYGTIYTIPDSSTVQVCYMKSGQYYIIGEKETLVSFLKQKSLKIKSKGVFHGDFVKGCRGRIVYGNIVVSEIVRQVIKTAATAGAGADIDILQSNPFIRSLLSVRSSDFAVEGKDGFTYSVGMYGVTGEAAEHLVMVSHFGIVSSSFLFTFADMLMARTGASGNQNINALFGDRENLKTLQQILGRAKVRKTADSVIVTLNVTKEESDRSLAGIKKIIEKNRQARAERLESEKISELTTAIINNDAVAEEKAITAIKNVNIKDLNGD